MQNLNLFMNMYNYVFLLNVIKFNRMCFSDSRFHIITVDLFVVSGNPHSHRNGFSEELGIRITRAKEAIDLVRDTMVEENDHLLSEKSVRMEIQNAVKDEWEKQRKMFVKESVPRTTVNWNPARDKKGNRFKGMKLLDRDAISRLNMVEVLKKVLTTGNFKEIDLIYNSIVESSCRHTMHTGPLKDGIPTVSVKDKCVKMEKVTDKKKKDKKQNSSKEGTSSKTDKKANKKEIPLCKRRFPRPIIKKRCIYQDPHKKSIYVVSTATNDNLYNANNPDRVLFHLSNCDDKVIVPGIFKKAPMVTWEVDGMGVTECVLEYFMDDEDTSDYTIKYALKGSR